jgi:hypothetical protein
MSMILEFASLASTNICANSVSFSARSCHWAIFNPLWGFGAGMAFVSKFVPKAAKLACVKLSSSPKTPLQLNFGAGRTQLPELFDLLSHRCRLLTGSFSRVSGLPAWSIVAAAFK